MVRRHHLALAEEQASKKHIQPAPEPKGKASTPEPQPKSAPGKQAPTQVEKSAPPAEKQAPNQHPAEPKAKKTAPQPEPEPQTKSEPKTAPAKSATATAAKSTPTSEKQTPNQHPAEPKAKTAPESEPEPKPAPAKQAPTTAPTKSAPAAPEKKPASQPEEEPKGKAPTPAPDKSAPASLKSSPPAPSKNAPSPVSHAPPPHQVMSSPAQSNDNDPKILGISTTFLIHLAIIAAIAAIVVFIIIKLYQRYRTRQDYNDTPENFAHKPVLGFNEEYYLSHTKIERVIAPERITIDEQNPINGKIWQVEFKGTEKSAVYFHRRQNTTAYFEVEVLSVHGAIEIGFVPVSSFAQIKSGQENIGNSGVGVTNSGYIQAQGENIYNYSWILVYGDVFGIGLTRQNSKFSERRAWISKNGVLLNYPPNDEMDRWLATIEISAEQKNQYNLGTEKKENEEQEDDKQDEQKAKEKLQRQKVEGLLKKQRISLKTFNKFQYYPVIVCHGNKDDNTSTIINVNVGGQVFRMFDAQFRSGLLKDKSLFGDD